MKVLHISTGYNHGGAAIACKRLVEAQRQVGIEAMILTQESDDFPEYVITTTHSGFKRRLNLFRLAWEKFVYFFYQSEQQFRFQYSLANTGENVAADEHVQDADIIHLHWINGGFLSLKNIKTILDLGKPVVWTLHDIWPLTGGCHIVADCENYKTNCIECYYLKSNKSKLSLKQQQQKNRIYNDRLHFIAPSSWQLERAKSSRIFGNSKIIKIPNPIELNKYQLNKFECREDMNLHPDKKIILFGAFNIQAQHKGMNYLLEALKKIPLDEEIEMVVFGKKSELFDQLLFKVTYLGYISNEKEMMMAYCAADLFVSPSIEDNLPNTILESFSVGTPVVAFETGGIPDIIDHKKNGYLAEYKNATDLANGIIWCLENNENGLLPAYVMQKIKTHFLYKNVGKEFGQFYESLI